MILGIDLGNQVTKTSNLVHFDSKVSIHSGLFSDSFQTQSGTYFIGEGLYDTEYRKVKKGNLKVLFLYALAQSPDLNNKAVVGLPIGQYQQDKNELKNFLLTDKSNMVILNGVQKRLNLEDVEVYPEGLINSEDGILVDIGGRTTDIARAEKGKVVSYFSIPCGTMNLYSDFIHAINCRYGLDLLPSDANRIIKKGLLVNGNDTDVTFAQDTFRTFVDDLVSQLQVKYPIKTLPVTILGGGGQLLFGSITKRIPNARLAPNPFYANAIQFERVGEAKWLNGSR